MNFLSTISCTHLPEVLDLTESLPPLSMTDWSVDLNESLASLSLKHLKNVIPFSEYKIHTFDIIETILLENGLK